MPASRSFRHLAIARHRATFVRATRNRWQRRLLFVVGGAAIGAAAAALAYLADGAQELFLHVLTAHRWLGLALPPFGFGVVVLAATRWFPNSQGSGIPQAIAAHRLSDSRLRARLVSLRIAAGKIVLMLLGLLSGASAGREGPTSWRTRLADSRRHRRAARPTRMFRVAPPPPSPSPRSDRKSVV